MRRRGWCVFWAGCWSAIGCGGNTTVSSDWSNDETSADGTYDERTFASSPSSSGTSGRSTPSGITASRAGTTGTATASVTTPGTNNTTTTLGTNAPTDGATLACGNGKLDAGEACDEGVNNSDTRADACRTSCVQASCGDGVRDEGENCDTGTQNSDTESDSCRTDCKLPRCGDGVVDVGRSEACDGTPDCGSRCTLAVCGDNVVEGQEECEPGVDANCGGDCNRASADNGSETGEPSQEATVPDQESSTEDKTVGQSSGDSTAHGSESSDPGGTTNDTSSGALDTINTGDLLFGFESDAEGWVLFETSPESLESGTRVVQDSSNGENSQGALELFGPFEDSDQKIEVQVTFDSARDMSGQVLHAKARLSNGLSVDRDNPGGIKLFVKTGANYSYASGAFVALTEGFDWVEFVLDLDDPELVFDSDEYDPTEVRQIGLELRTFEQTTGALPATVYVDSIGI